MDRPAELQKKRLLNFTVTKTEVERDILTVRGYFVVIDLWIQGLEYGSDIHYLTPPEDPMTWRLPRWLFPDTAVSEITAAMVERAVVDLMSKSAIEVVPPAPLEVPWHNIPPSKHKAVRAKEMRERQNLPEKS